MTKSLIYLTFLFYVSFGLIEKNEAKTLIKGDFNDFSTDDLEFIYTYKNEVLIKYNSNGQKKYEYSNKLLGDISSIDVSSSLKPLSFYQDRSTLIMLDNTLSLQGTPINLMDYNMGQVIMICRSVDNHFWFFDKRGVELIRVKKNLKRKTSTGNLNRIFDFEIKPTELTEYKSKVYLSVPSKGILVFDLFGGYTKTIPIKGIQDFQLYNDKIWYVKEKEFISYDLATFNTQKHPLPGINSFQKVRISDNHYYILNKKGITILNR